MKKLVVKLFGLIVCLSLMVCAVSCVAEETIEPREEFKGVFSSTEYADEESAVIGVVSKELTGDDIYGIYKSYNVIGELTEDELNGLNYDNVKREEISSAKKVEITYTLNEVVLTHVAYVMQFNEDSIYRYYVTQPGEGETLTKSYFDYLFDEDLMSNVTVNQKISMNVGQDIKISYSTSFKYAVRGAIGFSCTMSQQGAGQSLSAKYQGAILLNSRGVVKAYTLQEDNTYIANNSLKEVLYIGRDMNSSGIIYALKDFELCAHVRQGDQFVLREGIKEKVNQIIKEQESASSVHDYSTTINVSGGRITAIDIIMDLTVSGQRIKMKMNVTFTKYGKTTVRIPQELKDLNNNA